MQEAKHERGTYTQLLAISAISASAAKPEDPGWHTLHLAPQNSWKAGPRGPPISCRGRRTFKSWRVSLKERSPSADCWTICPRLSTVPMIGGSATLPQVFWLPFCAEGRGERAEGEGHWDGGIPNFMCYTIPPVAMGLARPPCLPHLLAPTPLFYIILCPCFTSPSSWFSNFAHTHPFTRPPVRFLLCSICSAAQTAYWWTPSHLASPH